MAFTCWSKEDFEEHLGFHVWKTSTSEENGESLYKCLKCEYRDEDSEKLKDHILKNHKNQQTLKCRFCDYEDNKWRGLTKHYGINHMKKD